METSNTECPDAAIAPHAAVAPQKQLKILVVEDSGLQGKAFLKLLAGLGYTDVTLCAESLNAFSLIEKNRYEVVFCDWNMPNLTGIEVLRDVRQDKQLKDIPFIFLTAHADRQKVIEALKGGAKDYIVKPATAPVIEQKLKTLFGQ